MGYRMLLISFFPDRHLKLNFSLFSTGLNSSLIIFIRTYSVNYRSALDRLRVRMNIILFLRKCKKMTSKHKKMQRDR